MGLILVVNGGSSSLKVALFENTHETPLWSVKEDCEGDYVHVLEQVLRTLPSQEITAIGHRVVHGGERFSETTRITDSVKKQIREQFFLAPLHNPANLAGIELCEKLFPTSLQFAVFDTAFHKTLSEVASTYPIPYKYRREGVRRYGFHGISYSYCSKRVATFLNSSLQDLKIVACHLGAGASLCAIKNGKSVDTTMGMTPLEGLMMATRCGSVDPGVLLYLLKEQKLSVDFLEQELNFASGLLGISGQTKDMRPLLQGATEGNERSQLAIEIFVHRLTSCIGSMIAALEGLDVLIFTAGIGEHFPLIRAQACAPFAFLGLEVDSSKNTSPSPDEREISSLTSRIKALVIPTREELEIARECQLQLAHVS